MVKQARHTHIILYHKVIALYSTKLKLYIMKFDYIGTLLPLAAVAGVGYFAIVYGPGLMDTLNTSIQTALGAGQIAPPTTSGTTGTCTTGNAQTDQLYQQAGIDICQATGQTGASGTTGTCSTGNAQLDAMYRQMGINVCQVTGGTAGQGPLNQGIPGAFGSALRNTGFPGLIPGTTPPNFGSNILGQFPQFTGAPQYTAAPTGVPNCAGGVCRSFEAIQLNGY
jgi:hypothetical protein